MQYQHFQLEGAGALCSSSSSFSTSLSSPWREQKATRAWKTRLLEGAEHVYPDSTLTGDIMASQLDATISVLGSHGNVLPSTLVAAEETETTLKAWSSVRLRVPVTLHPAAPRKHSCPKVHIWL